jgi:hypothetical protein
VRRTGDGRVEGERVDCDRNVGGVRYGEPLVNLARWNWT